MVKLVDTLGSGSSGSNAVEVQVLFRAKIADSALGAAIFVFGGRGLEREPAARAMSERKHPWKDV